MQLTLVLIVWRLSLFIIAAIGSRLVPFSPTFPYSDIYLLPTRLPQWIWAWANFDGVHYLTIAGHGYMAQFTQAFFPLFPLLVKAVSYFFRDKYMIVSGLFLTFLLLGGSLQMFKQLLELDYKEAEIRQIIMIFLLFPTSFFFGALYSEPMFFLLTAAAFWFARKEKWWLSGVCGLFAAATRITGILLLPALLWEWHYGNLQSPKKLSSFNKFILKTIHEALYALQSPITYLVPLGLILYMVYLQITFGDALYFWHAQSAFGAARSGSGIILLPQVVWRYLKILFSAGINSSAYWSAFLELTSFTVAAILLLVAGRLKVRSSYLIFGWLVLLIPTLTGTLSSMPRYILLAFPIFIPLGLIKNKRYYYLACMISGLILILLTARFIQGQWVA